MIPNLLILLKLNSWYKWEVITSGNISPISSTIRLRSVDGCLIHLIRKCIYIEPMKTHTDERNLEMLVLSSKLSSKLFKQQVPRTKSPSTNKESALSWKRSLNHWSVFKTNTIFDTFHIFFPFPSYSTTIKWSESGNIDAAFMFWKTIS